ncbi:glutamate synthase subunit beta [Desulfurispira natronophila]|uniref:Glutamate synthase (NADPH/NADH) small chain n=1 Tax=Desulfurispira natronophila TaxID=682562 RepID=A0A7W7Y446_9BACT|nr:glutamate synthase subunit beta [Desulfurispira natronophila]MBB5021710.1 glutamate synthase (NADPH/NADH) small chain [Desulfurispira natronophila]
MQTFIDTHRSDPRKLSTKDRIQNYQEIYERYTRFKASQQAERCIQCGDPFCSATGCPLTNHIPQWLKAVAEDDLETAFALSNETSPFPEILGRVCPQNKLCEGDCSLNDGWGAITIGSIETAITELGFDHGLCVPYPGITRDLRVAVVGSGPAGMSAAHFLLRAGIGVDMYERASHPGGLLTYGIPGFKLEKDVVKRRFAIMEQAGLRVHLNCTVGKDILLDQLYRDYDAVFLGIGATQGRRLGLAGEDTPQVHMALDYLTAVQGKLFGDHIDKRYNVHDRRVVVVGGGDTAMDCLRTAVREGASQVTCLYRRDEANMPGSTKEYISAREEGAQFHFNQSPKELLLDDSGNLYGMRFVETSMGERDADGRQKVSEVPGTEHIIEADMVILSLGFEMEDHSFLKKEGLQLTSWGTVEVDRNQLTSHSRLFAGGDCVRGADLVVTAALDGRQAALAIMDELLGE